jgi:uncharacterized membrane protein
MPLGWRSFSVQTLDNDGLLDFASKRAGVIRMEKMVGEFVVNGTPIASLWLPKDAQDGKELNQADTDAVNSHFVCGRTRTVFQDATFGIQLIVDVALKALSPGINDTATAINCIDALSGILARAADREEVSNFRTKDGSLRVIAKGADFESLVNHAFTPIRRNGNLPVYLRLLQAFQEIGYRTAYSERRLILKKQMQSIIEHVKQCEAIESDRDEVIEQAEQLSKQFISYDQRGVRG